DGELESARDAYRRAVVLDPAAADADLAGLLEAPAEPGGAPVVEPQDTGATEAGASGRSTISFADVGGMEDVKEQVRLKILHPLSHPELYAAYGKTAGGGILLYGPPGCGKTH